MTVLARLTTCGRLSSVFMEWNSRYVFLGGFLSESAAKSAAERIACNALGRHLQWRNS
jgi:hypothetical protein